jgi:integrase
MGQEHRSLPLSEWPSADRAAWQDLCRPAIRLVRGGALSHLKEISRADYANRYGAFLGFLQRIEQLRMDLSAGALVTSENVEAYLTDLQSRVTGVSQYNFISKLRRAAKALASAVDFNWLYELEMDLKLVMRPQARFDRLVTTNRLIEAGLVLIEEAKSFKSDPVQRAVGVRNGLIIAVLALWHIRLRNYAELELGRTFRQIDNTWWVTIPNSNTKTQNRPIEKPLPRFMNRNIEFYLTDCRPILLRDPSDKSLWISSTTGRALTKKPLGTLISKITLQTLGVDVSPHLFRHAASTTAAEHPGAPSEMPSAMLGHTSSRTNEAYYNRPRSIGAARLFQDIVSANEEP